MALDDLAGLAWRPAFEYLDCDVPIAIEFSIPQRPWTYSSRAIGGYDEATSGVQESFVLRHDRIYTIRMRLTETEWVELLEPMLRTIWGQPQVFTIFLDANDDATAMDVTLVSPWMGDGAQPSEHDCPGVLEIDISVRSDDGLAFPYPYFPDLDLVELF